MKKKKDKDNDKKFYKDYAKKNKKRVLASGGTRKAARKAKKGVMAMYKSENRATKAKKSSARKTARINKGSTEAKTRKAVKDVKRSLKQMKRTEKRATKKGIYSYGYGGNVKSGLPKQMQCGGTTKRKK